MERKNFSIPEAIDFGWCSMKNNFWLFAILLIILGVFSAISDRFSKSAKDLPILIVIITNLVFLFLNVMIHIGIIKISLKLANNQKGEFVDFFSSLHLFFKFLFASIVYGLIVLAGFILLIIPGIIWSVQFGFFGYLIISHGLGISASLKKSSEITSGIKGKLLIFYLLLFVINLAGLLCLIIGLFVAIPTTIIAGAYVYRKLLDQALVNTNVSITTTST